MATKLSHVAQAYARSKPAREALRALDARCMECTEDKAGIVWERFILPKNGVSVILVATPHWWNVFAPVTHDGAIDATLEALRKLAEQEVVHS